MVLDWKSSSPICSTLSELIAEGTLYFSPPLIGSLTLFAFMLPAELLLDLDPAMQAWAPRNYRLHLLLVCHSALWRASLLNTGNDYLFECVSKLASILSVGVELFLALTTPSVADCKDNNGVRKLKLLAGSKHFFGDFNVFANSDCCEQPWSCSWDRWIARL